MNSQSHDLTHKVLTGIDEAYWQWDLINESIFYSAQLMKLLGYASEEKIGASIIWEKHLDSTSLEEVHAKIQQHLKGDIERLDVTLPITNNQGEQLWLHAVGKVVEHIDGRASLMFGTVKDVTETKSMIVQLKKQNDWLMLAERISNSGHWRFDIKSQTLDWSAEVFRIYGLTNKSIIPSFEQALAPILAKDRPKFRTCFHNAIHQQQPFYLKTALTQPSGRKVKVEVIAEVERDCNGIVMAVFGVYKDITRSEDLFEKLKLLAMVNFTIKVPIFFIDDNDNVVYQDISPHHDGVSAVLFNYINFSITEYMEFKKLAKTQGQIKENNVSFDKYNTVFDLSVTYEADEGIYIWIVENVTDKFRKEQQQVISNRLALLGNTFGNVSHDINNVLGVALGAIEMLEIKFSRGEQDISSYIDRVKNAIDKGKDVTERLLAFTRKPTVKVVSFDPIQDIFDNQYLFKQLLLSTININFNFQPMHCLINFPQGEFINILLNLVLNAQDAIQEKGLSGQIEISANLLDNSRLEIHVKDSGIGIAKENLTKIFDPFYSSKSVNKGNGIGLANVYSTMYKHNGLIQVEGNSDLGGAHFTLVFKCKTLKEKYLPNEPKLNSLRYQNTNILVLDDEVSIAEFVALFLESKGAKVVVANNKEQLIEKINSDVKFEIFITDMILPDLSGKEAVNMVTEKYPDINVFSISGYIAIEDRSWDYPVLRKPFNSKELAEFLAI
ncbi:ATP-binding protein [Colwellia psychrerythraea]|uniref:histidine kinase n=1 Tax=Colwellia psychrerythraea TaxID=28229 RepID=A0A099KBK3_COLPS|nr:ATP-binding protein [Colwellia psychrerythraea]KGJ87670.1 putative PAS/PAC sensor protein [Colwellia psychrerythraea]